MEAIEFHALAPSDYEQVRGFLSSVGWESRVKDAGRFKVMMERADRTVVAWEGEAVVGFGRALCDDVSNGYLSMIVVAPHKRRRGIGREIIRRLIEPGGDAITWVLRAGHDSGPFWEKLGFVHSEIAMERTRQE
jgi:GNAT superfamily N-acetyltransferase